MYSFEPKMFYLIFSTATYSVTYPVLHWAKAEILKGLGDVFGESWAKHILVCSKLMSRLPDNRIHHIQTCYLVLGFTLKRKKTNKS